ncbi:MAG TPA: hypothetical protein VNO26_06480, partial [Candidatus Limnocylindria bacterium]|nr:hypothetical protein [Candidatus Limnocylindria bacterium]
MSSILEALKELESERARAAKKTTSVVDMPPEPERTSLGAFIPLAGGLALGVVVFGVYLWTAGGDPLPPTSSPSTLEQPADRPAAPGPREPDWLSRAEPPRARVAPPPAPA